MTRLRPYPWMGGQKTSPLALDTSTPNYHCFPQKRATLFSKRNPIYTIKNLMDFSGNYVTVLNCSDSIEKPSWTISALHYRYTSISNEDCIHVYTKYMLHVVQLGNNRELIIITGWLACVYAETTCWTCVMLQEEKEEGGEEGKGETGREGGRRGKGETGGKGGGGERGDREGRVGGEVQRRGWEGRRGKEGGREGRKTGWVREGWEERERGGERGGETGREK